MSKVSNLNKVVKKIANYMQNNLHDFLSINPQDINPCHFAKSKIFAMLYIQSVSELFFYFAAATQSVTNICL